MTDEIDITDWPASKYAQAVLDKAQDESVEKAGLGGLGRR